MYEIVDYMSLRKLLAQIETPEGYQLAYDKVISESRITGALFVNPTNGNYIIADEFGFIRVDKKRMSKFLSEAAISIKN